MFIVDVLILADVFQKFREVSLEVGRFEIDPAHYLSAPQMSWDAMLKRTAVELDLITDPAMYLMIEGGMRGGVCVISQRHSKANFPAMGREFDPSQPNTFILYVDSNNLYGWAMSQVLPSGGFEWVSREEWENINWVGLSETDLVGYFVECDLEYPAELHADHNDYPLAPERGEIEPEMLSENQMEITRHYARTRTRNNVKLVPNLMKKIKYTTHYLNLKFYLDHGLRLSKIHRVIRFQQSAWMRPYIQMNTALRATAANDMERDFHKLMNNSVYGKTCENQRKRTDIRLMNDRVEAAKLLDKPHCIDVLIFDENLVGGNCGK